MQKFKIINVVGARPNFMKIAPLVEAMKDFSIFSPHLVHTGQHYDRKMSEIFFEQLNMPKPDIYLGVGSGDHGAQTGKVMIEFEKVVQEFKPHLVVVVGDVNSTIACSLVATKLGARVAHVEAGLRSFNRQMPEEINRILTDQISDFLFTTEEEARVNLTREGISPDKIHFVGNVMIDTLFKHREKARQSDILQRLGLTAKNYVLVTLHRPANVDNRQVLAGLLQALATLSDKIPVLFPLHPRTRKQIDEFNLAHVLDHKHFFTLEPLGYLDFLSSMDNARLVLTDSGGIQEETTALQVPCLTAREETERPITVNAGTNTVVGSDPDNILKHVFGLLNHSEQKSNCPRFWDGKSAERIVEILRREFETGGLFQ